MRIRAIFVLQAVLLVFSLLNSGWAQQDQQSQGSADAHEAAGVPPALAGLNPQLLWSGGENILVGRLRASGLYDDNPINSSVNRIHDYQYSITPSFGLQQIRSHTRWSLDYTGGATFDQQIAARDLITNSLHADLQHNFTRRLALHLREDYSISSDPFANLSQPLFVPSIGGGPGQLNPFVATPIGKRTASASIADLDYQLGEFTSVGASGSFSTEKFRDVAGAMAGSQGLIDTQTTAGRTFIARQITRAQVVGAEYQLEDFRFDSGRARTIDQTLFLFDQIALPDHMTLALFAGPEHSHVHDALVLNSDFSKLVIPLFADSWSVAGGVTYTWQGKQTGLAVSGIRNASNGGGLLSSVRLTGVSVQLRRNLTAKWAVSVLGFYATSRSIAGRSPSLASVITTREADLTLERQLTRNLALDARYARVQQPQSIQTGGRGIDRNRIEIGITYQFTRPVR